MVRDVRAGIPNLSTIFSVYQYWIPTVHTIFISPIFHVYHTTIITVMTKIVSTIYNITRQAFGVYSKQRSIEGWKRRVELSRFW